jgi:hypothetical protein
VAILLPFAVAHEDGPSLEFGVSQRRYKSRIQHWSHLPPHALGRGHREELGRRRRRLRRRIGNFLAIAE